MAKPATVIKIALYPDGRVQCGLEGQGNKAMIAQGMAFAIQSILSKLDEQAREPGISIPDGNTAKQLLAAR